MTMTVATKTKIAKANQSTKSIEIKESHINAKDKKFKRISKSTATPSAKRTFLLRFRESDSLGGISKETIELLSAVTGLTLTDLIHHSLLNLAEKYIPAYELDNSQLTEVQIDEISARSQATNTPDESFDQRLF